MKKKKHAQNMRTVAFEKRDKFAEKLFDIDTVYLKIKSAAAQGFLELRLFQSEFPVSLKSMTYAVGLTKQLKKDGFKYHWVSSTRKEFAKDKKGREIETGQILEFEELQIFWEDAF